MSTVIYSVYTTFTNPTVADAWLRWLREGHIAEVLAGGALAAEIAELDTASGERSFAVRYHFASRESFTAYERDHAPRLRAEGLRLFSTDQGVTCRRTVGTVLQTFAMS